MQKKHLKVIQDIVGKISFDYYIYESDSDQMVSYLCSCRAWLMSIFDTTSPYTNKKSERTRDFASTSLSTSPRERYISEVMMWTVFGEVGRHHFDFLSDTMSD